MNLFPTPTRLALLRDIRAGRVLGLADGTAVLTVDGTPRFVTERVREMHRAAWLMPPARPGAAWDVAEGGLAVLAAADRTEKAAEVAAEHFHLSPGDLKGHRS